MSFLRDDPSTTQHPLIKQYLETCESLRPNGFLHADDVTSPEILAYASSLLIMRWNADRDDFIYRLHGTDVAAFYGMDLTGKCVGDGDHQETERPFIDAHLECLRDNKLVYLGGTIHWRQRNHRKWNQVSMPLERDDSEKETLTFATFD